MASWRPPSAIVPSPRYICRECARSLRRPFPVPPAALRRLQTSASTPQDVTPKPPTPLRKLLKEEAKRKKADLKKTSGASKSGNPSDKWELTVGIEIHAELNTARKLFSHAATSSSAPPNTHVSVFDLAFPGAQPNFQRETLIPAIRAALALECDVQRISRWDRKHYFYQDQPNGYQITQYYEPFAKNGTLTLYPHDGIAPQDGPSVTIGIKQIQLEQDTAKTLAQPPSLHLLDFNRVSHPLIEIITLPQIHHPATAAALVHAIQARLRAVDAVTTGMEQGGLRADVNVSVRRRDAVPGPHAYAGVTGLGTRTEIKNLSSFKGIEDAIRAERDRQIQVLEAGGVVEGETRSWNLGATETKKLRGKEGEVDYRYMPDPDLGPVVVGADLVDALWQDLPPLPGATVEALVADGVSRKDAKTIVDQDERRASEFPWLIAHISRDELGSAETAGMVVKTVGDWVLHELPRFLQPGDTFDNLPWLSPTTFASIISLELRGEITRETSRFLVGRCFEGDTRPINRIVDDEQLRLEPMTDADYAALATEVVEANPAMVQTIRKQAEKRRGGEKGKVMWLVGQMIRRRGQIAAGPAEGAVRKVLGLP